MNVTILGAGLTGLTLAYLLKKKGVSSKIIEARDRVGGRILTDYKEGQAPMEMGATWLGLKHQNLVLLLEELGLDIYEQHTGELAVYEAMSTSPPQLVTLPPNPEPSYRIKGGTSKLITTLKEQVSDQEIILGEKAISISKEDDFVFIKTDKNRYESTLVVSTLPPFLLHKNIAFTPSLSPAFTEVAPQTHTWMGESIKVGLRYKKAFWRKEGTSGTIFSNVGPVTEMYDHADADTSVFALKGFMNGAYATATKEQRKQLVINQLKKYYGEVVESFIAYEETVWSEEAYTFSPYPSPVLPHQNNGNTIFRKEYYDGKFFIAGSETAPQFSGYMDAAVASAKMVAERVLSVLV